MRRRLACLVLLIAGCAPVVMAQGAAAPGKAAPARNEAGKVEVVEGAVSVAGADGARRSVRVGEVLFEGDAITTGSDGELHAELLDGGVIAVRPNTLLRITRYKAEGGAADASFFNLVKGSFRSITGWIAQRNPVNYRIQTPTATVGVRGTDHEPLVIPEGSREGEPGTYDRVHVGATRVQGKSGAIDVAAGRTGFHPGRAGVRPRLLEGMPSFYRAGRQDRRLEGRHERVRQVLETRREERRKVIEQRRRDRESELRREREVRRADESRRQAERAERRRTEQAARRDAREGSRRAEREQHAAGRPRPEAQRREIQNPRREGTGGRGARDPSRDHPPKGRQEPRREPHGRADRH